METLKPLNILYDHEHRLTQQDVDMANGYVELIERTRSEKIPQVGDRLIYVDRYGKYYGNALIEKRKNTDGLISICEIPYIPFIWEEYDGIGLSVSGGSFHHIDPPPVEVRQMDGRDIPRLGQLRCVRQRCRRIHGKSAVMVLFRT